MTIHEVFQSIELERARQDILVEQKKLPWNCADRGVMDHQKLSVLMEEVGELARELNDQAPGFRERVKRELQQVAAVATGWLESLTS